MSDNHEIDGERAVSEVAGNRRPWLSRQQIGIIIALAALAVICLVLWRVPMNKDKDKEDAVNGTTPRLGQMVPYVPPHPEPIVPVVARVVPPPPPPLVPSNPPLAQQIQTAVAPPTPKHESWFVSYNPGQLPQYLQKKDAPADSGKLDETRVVYKSATVVGASAGTIPDRNLILMPGVIRCTLSTAINSDIAGPLMCTLPGDVLSPTGVTLMEKGTQVIGSYSSQVSQGQKRLMTVAATAYTPNGVVVPLGNSPMADALGRAGLDGEVNNHIWERFGGAVLLTLADGLFSLGQSALSKGGNTYLSLNGGGGVSSLAQDVLRATINIPPTIEVHQGADVALWITGPISFQKSYQLVPEGR